MNGPMSRREENTLESQRRVLEAATELVAEVGPREASLQAVSDRARISRGSITWHFKSKDALVSEVIVRAFAQAAEGFKARIEAREPSLSAIFDAHWALLESGAMRVIHSCHTEAWRPNSPLADAYRTGYAGMRQIYADALRPLLGKDPGAPDAMGLATAFFGMALGVNAQHNLSGDVDREGACQAMIELVNAGLAKHSRP